MASRAQSRSIYRCQSCAHIAGKWLGRCPGCGEWNTLVEEIERPARLTAVAAASGRSGRPVPVSEVESGDVAPRLATGIGELDRVLGGGLVPGSLVLLGGDPGIGKSTLLLQALDGLARGGATILYVSGEESVAQTGLRARRLGVSSERLLLHSETGLERILAEAESISPAVLAIDSIQTVHTDALESVPGSIAQVRECAARLLAWAKTRDIAVILVGHVTKDGSIAGPKTLEHVVDAVLQFEGEGAQPYRIVRGIKNRFGSTSEIGVFTMRVSGLAEVKNPSELFLAERPVGAPGSIVVASADGSRPLLVEVQALVAPPSAGIGRRTATGVDVSRVSLLLAVLAERAGVNVLARDVFVNVAGGVRLGEPAIDLAVACAVASAERRVAIPGKTVVFGEVGLAGEIRAVSLPEIRLAEAAKLGFQRALLPRQDHAKLEPPPGLELIPVDHLRTALGALGSLLPSRAQRITSD